MDLGIVIGGELRTIPDLARRAEEAGFESVWVAETARSVYVQAALAAQATERITVGTAVALAFPRSPAITAMTARDLAELSGGRFVLGLGSQVKRVNEERFGVPFEHPAPKMAEYVEAVRAVLGSFGGVKPEHQGRVYSITMATFPGALRRERHHEPRGPGRSRRRPGPARGRPADRLLRHDQDLRAGAGHARIRGPDRLAPQGVRAGRDGRHGRDRAAHGGHPGGGRDP